MNWWRKRVRMPRLRCTCWWRPCTALPFSLSIRKTHPVIRLSISPAAASSFFQKHAHHFILSNGCLFLTYCSKRAFFCSGRHIKLFSSAMARRGGQSGGGGSTYGWEATHQTVRDATNWEIAAIDRRRVSSLKQYWSYLFFWKIFYINRTSYLFSKVSYIVPFFISIYWTCAY